MKGGHILSRSVKKGPYVAESLEKKIDAFNDLPDDRYRSGKRASFKGYWYSHL